MHRRDGQLIVSATDLVGFLACGHLTHLERAAVAGLVDKPIRDDPEVELLQRRGLAHEARYIELLERHGRRVTPLDGDRERSYEARAAETLAAMQHGDDVIYQATVFDGRFVGHPDFLLRVGDRGLLGVGHHYEVADTKLAHSAKASALVQICSYVEQIQRLQGVMPERVHVVTGGAEVGVHSFRTAEMMAFFRHAKARFEAAVDDARAGTPEWPIPRETSYPDPVDHCAVCRWSLEQCRPTWRRDDALPLVAGISRRQRQALVGSSVMTMRALSEMTHPLAVDGLKQQQLDSLWRVRQQARLQVLSQGREVPVHELLEPERDTQGNLVADRGLAALPPPDEGDVFFDIEGDPFAYWEGLDYLFGVWTPEGEWHATWATDRAAEKQAFERVIDFFMERLDRFPGMHVYHYAPYEPTTLKRLAGRHATREEELDRLLRGRVLVDLYRVVRQSVRVGAERYSIKNLEPLYGFQREVDLRSAGESIVEFEQWLETGRSDQRLLDDIEAYNRDDCVSTQRLRDWLEQQRAAAEAQFALTLPRPPAGDFELDPERSEREQAVLELERRLGAGVPDDPRQRTPEQHAHWLLGQLLDWHRRELKSAYWRFYDLMGRTDDELFEEREPIARLEYVGIVPDAGTKQSHDHRYGFPVQEHSIDVNSKVHDAQLVGQRKTIAGRIVAIDKDAGTIDIRRHKTWDGLHPTALVPLDAYPGDAQRDALMRIGRWVAENGVDSEQPPYRAARDLLLRRPPRVAGGDSGPLVRVELGEPGSDAAYRLGPLLDSTTLSIQGPPGSGKTYTGARMIVDLVARGRRVGITANSHKVIANLLDAVGRAAQERPDVDLRGLQKVDGGDGCRHPLVRLVDDNAAVHRALVEGQVDVVGGTTWMWARDEFEGIVDTLFVDEAGQMSLANVVAISGAARNVVLLGDPQQLDQPTQGVHPEGAGRSALAHLLDGLETLPPDKGVFLEKTWRMHPAITSFTSQLFYAGKLDSVEGLDRQRVTGDDWLAGAGTRWMPVEHDGNTNASAEEVERVGEIVEALVGREWTDRNGRVAPLALEDIVIVSPFNAHRLLLQERLGSRARVGTVDKFQGQEAPVSIYTMATSRPEDAPRGVDFLYSLNRLNVATSRARALAVVVASPALLGAVPRTPHQLRMVNGLCAFVEAAQGTPAPAVASYER